MSDSTRSMHLRGPPRSMQIVFHGIGGFVADPRSTKEYPIDWAQLSCDGYDLREAIKRRCC
ncbi:hypothetical protein Q5Y75_17600 [Ruegeria sp. 2205SS24-7]|uniref:hypothetical protein n=1 Tax=Ruegeria discodermiae TaxID=3064389 RepID=UPI002740DC74|nr:hypothetical protein [Ruegeria sp. 2205SS24-7]MDP5219036.1 hypothetical protein [Ruegeria sp. 2205SS24-7]